MITPRREAGAKQRGASGGVGPQVATAAEGARGSDIGWGREQHPEPGVRAVLTCNVVVRLDGHDPCDGPPESADDFREEFRAFWLRFEAWLRQAGIKPMIYPSHLEHWNVRFYSQFLLADAPRVVAWLEAQGVTVEDTARGNVGDPVWADDGARHPTPPGG